MTILPPKRFAKTLAWGLCALTALGVLGVVLASVLARLGNAHNGDTESDSSVRLVAGTTNTLLIQPNCSIGVRTSRVEPAGSHQRLQLCGSIYLDSNRLVRVHSRFAGEVVALGACGEDAVAVGSQESGPRRPVRLGDRVKKGQLLAVIWSKDVGEKKSDLVDALSRLANHKLQSERLNKLRGGLVADKDVLQAELDYKKDIIEVERIERTLRSWRLTEEEIDLVRDEAEKIQRGEHKPDLAMEKRWADVEVRAPLDGVVLEKNIAVGDIADTDLDLFKVADLSTLGVMAHAYEEDLPTIEALRPDDRRWTIKLRSQPDSAGTAGGFDLISNIIDPNQHTAAVMGWLKNADGRLKVGQFVTATIDLPAAPDEVAVPDSAVIEEGADNIVFVSNDAKGEKVSRRYVSVVRRVEDYVYIRSRPNAEERARGCEPLAVGDWIVTAGTIELAGALEDALALAPVQENVKK